MLKIKVIGAGAAGNKAAIQLHKNGFNMENITLINSTSKDIPMEYKNYSMIFGATNESLGGCGKERNVGKKLILRDLQNGAISLESCVDPDTNVVVIVSSTEGGSGSAITPILAKYISKVMNVPVIVCLFFGFNTDVRGMQNSIEICQELIEDYGVIGISNESFLEDASGNKIKAENLANEEFCKIVRILTGQDIKPGSQNIDDTDLYKLVVTPGYMFVGSASLKGCRNADMFNKAINAELDKGHLIESSTKSVKRIGGIFDIPATMSDQVDYEMTTLVQRYGVPYEKFTHIQPAEDYPRVSWIVGGMDLPIEHIKDVFENYKKSSESVNKIKDAFFDEVQTMAGNQADQEFNLIDNSRAKSAISKSDFFEGFK